MQMLRAQGNYGESGLLNDDDDEMLPRIVQGLVGMKVTQVSATAAPSSLLHHHAQGAKITLDHTHVPI